MIDNSLIRGKFHNAIIFVKGNIRFRIFLGGAFWKPAIDERETV